MLKHPGPTPDARRDETVGVARGVSIVAPTFREAENIPILVARVQAAMEEYRADWELILSDDDSDDGTEEIATSLGLQLPVRIQVRRDQPRDLSLAVLDGFRLARFDRLVVMDADLSHPPEQIPELLAALDGGAEMALGSRYAAGGVIDETWRRFRALNSRVSTWLARPLVACADPMSGFFALDRRRLPDLDRLDPIGYKIGLELMVRGRLRVREVPIRFDDRRQGSSKLNWRQRVAFLRHLLRLYLFRFEAPCARALLRRRRRHWTGRRQRGLSGPPVGRTRHLLAWRDEARRALLAGHLHDVPRCMSSRWPGSSNARTCCPACST